DLDEAPLAASALLVVLAAVRRDFLQAPNFACDVAHRNEEAVPIHPCTAGIDALGAEVAVLGGRRRASIPPFPGFDRRASMKTLFLGCNLGPQLLKTVLAGRNLARRKCAAEIAVAALFDVKAPVTEPPHRR